MRRNIFKRFDLFGRKLTLEDEDSQVYSTILGAIISTISIIIIIILGFLFGKEIYLRKSPRVIISDEIINTQEVDLSNFPIFLSFYDFYGNPFNDITQYFDFYTSLTSINEEMEISYLNYVGIEECNESFFNLHQDIVRSKIETAKQYNSTLFCLNASDDFKLRNTIKGNNRDFFRFTIQDCDVAVRNSAINILNPEAFLPCNSNKETTNSIYLKIDYLDSLVDSNDYASPVKYYEKSILERLTRGLFKTYYLVLSNQVFIADYGWILESNNEHIHLKVEVSSEILMPILKERYIISLDTSTFRKKSVRSYLKCQELFAKIGGLFNAVLIFNKIFLDFYVNFKFQTFYGKIIIDSAQPKNEAENAKILNLNKQNDKSFFRITHSNSLCENNEIRQEGGREVREREREENKSPSPENHDNSNGNEKGNDFKAKISLHNSRSSNHNFKEFTLAELHTTSQKATKTNFIEFHNKIKKKGKNRIKKNENGRENNRKQKENEKSDVSYNNFLSSSQKNSLLVNRLNEKLKLMKILTKEEDGEGKFKNNKIEFDWKQESQKLETINFFYFLLFSLKLNFIVPKKFEKTFKLLNSQTLKLNYSLKEYLKGNSELRN